MKEKIFNNSEEFDDKRRELINKKIKYWSDIETLYIKILDSKYTFDEDKI